VDLAAPALPTGPDVAAAKSTAKRTMIPKSDGKFDLTKEARLENGSLSARVFLNFCRAGRCGHVFGLSMRR